MLVFSAIGGLPRDSPGVRGVPNLFFTEWHAPLTMSSRAEGSERTSGLERIGGGSQLRDFGGDIAVLDQLGIAVGYLERGFVLLAPEPEVELVLGKRSVSGPAQRQHGWLNGGAR